jgi:Carboxypeptidase regulatory-like domain
MFITQTQTVFSFSFLFGAIPSSAQLGNSGSIEGVVKDASGGVVAGAKVEVSNPVSGFRREIITASDGSFRITNVPFNPYHTVVSAAGFALLYVCCGGKICFAHNNRLY